MASDEIFRSVQELQGRTRKARQGFWFPLSLTGLALLAALPLYLQPAPSVGTVPGVGGPLAGAVGGTAVGHGGRELAVFWLVALPLVYLLTAVYYRRRAARVGVATAVWPFVVTGLALLALLVVACGRSLGITPALPADLTIRGLAVLLPVGLAVLTLARYERSVGLAMFAVAFLGIALFVDLYDLANLLPASTRVADGRAALFPNVVVPAVALLLAGGWSRARQRPHP